MSKKEEIIDFSRYTMSDPIVKECEGCERVFDFPLTDKDGNFLGNLPKCRAYANPGAQWKKKPVAMKTVTIYSKSNPRGLKQQIPAAEFRCRLATHVVETEVETNSSKSRAGQQKQKKRR